MPAYHRRQMLPAPGTPLVHLPLQELSKDLALPQLPQVQIQASLVRMQFTGHCISLRLNANLCVMTGGRSLTQPALQHPAPAFVSEDVPLQLP